MQIASKLSDVLGRFLDVTGDQLKLTAQNMANSDTPGYRTQGLNFSDAFARAMREGEGQYTDAGSEISGLVARPDGNNVSMDREGMDLAKEQLQFRTGVELLKREYARTMSAIHADGK